MSTSLFTINQTRGCKNTCIYSIRSYSGTPNPSRHLNPRNSANKNNENDSGDSQFRPVVQKPGPNNRTLRYAQDFKRFEDSSETVHELNLRKLISALSHNRKRKNNSYCLPGIRDKRQKYYRFIIEETEDESDDDFICQKPRSSANSPPNYKQSNI